ncbi:UDP-N-acetylmuramate dehydrogenase [Gillisia sp. M10.2A]|uniref:UDP-N-acetylenolpyruvoylglucosamine reductase n=1 Tax=Gillisia lutea TaxID=2909668 RepID=A0ABS9EIG5_9FLAO|nr:UDP-N-acetylmuramate dehydrogenase [Gillisia lutea]MCF4102653.1 UDP-N-acetylmuramate dehydrogenase [Gillisia lutea]
MILKLNQDLTLYNNYRVKSVCKRAFFPQNEEDFIDLYKENINTKKIILGGGYNVILSKQTYNEDFLLIGETFSKYNVVDNIIEAQAGIEMKKMSEIALAHNLSGLEVFYDIPSSLGGAIVMNAGASGSEIKDHFLKARYLDLDDLKIKEISKEEASFEYRNSFFQKNTNKIVLKVWLKLAAGDPVLIKSKMDEIKTSRWAKQPKDYPNAGSVFKRPDGFYVGTMIEELGLKGFSVGGAQVSRKHAGFIINYNNATGDDILNLIEEIQNRVYKAYNVNLEVEQRII